MNHDDIRTEFLLTPWTVRGLLLTDKELEVFALVKLNGSLTSAQLAPMIRVESTCATTHLKNCLDKGYLDRAYIPDDNRPGRQTYRYTVKEKFK